MHGLKDSKGQTATQRKILATCEQEDGMFIKCS